MTDIERIQNELEMLLEYTPHSSDLDTEEKEEALEGLRLAMDALKRLAMEASTADREIKFLKEQISRYLHDRDNLHAERDRLVIAVKDLRIERDQLAIVVRELRGTG